MSLALFIILAFVSSLAGGILGSMLGFGGGIVVIPMFTLVFGLRIQEAVAVSIISVIATSGGSAMNYLRERLANVRVALLLALGTTSGAVTGALLAGRVNPQIIYFLFGGLLVYCSLVMFRGRPDDPATTFETAATADLLQLRGAYYDRVLRREVRYQAARPLLTTVTMYFAGILAGLLGIGAGPLKVLAMNQMMGLPIKVSTSTSTFLIGITGVAGAMVYISRGQIQPVLVAPVVLGVLAGTLAGTRIMPRLRSSTVKALFVPAILYVALQMLWKGWHLG